MERETRIVVRPSGRRWRKWFWGVQRRNLHLGSISDRDYAVPGIWWTAAEGYARSEQAAVDKAQHWLAAEEEYIEKQRAAVERLLAKEKIRTQQTKIIPVKETD